MAKEEFHSKPELTVLVSSYNHAEYVTQCLDSVASQLTTDMELVIIDDASSDDTVRKISDWLAANSIKAITRFRTTNQGVCKSLNEGLSISNGKYFCHVAADDWIADGRLDAQLKAFQRGPASVGIVFSDVMEVSQTGEFIRTSPLTRGMSEREQVIPQDIFFECLARGNFIPSPGAMVNKSACERAGRYDPDLYIEDYDLWLRIAREFDAVYLPFHAANYRILETSLSHNIAGKIRFMSNDVRVLLKQIGYSPGVDQILERRLRGLAIRISIESKAEGLENLSLISSRVKSFENTVLKLAMELTPEPVWKKTMCILTGFRSKILGATFSKLQFRRIPT